MTNAYRRPAPGPRGIIRWRDSRLMPDQPSPRTDRGAGALVPIGSKGTHP